MTREEYASWQRETARSTTQWRLDELTHQNRGELLLYKGGTDGIYVCVDQTGLASGGSYEGALPHIGEACFIRQHTRQYDSQDEAFRSLCERFGCEFLLSVLDLT